MSDLFINLPVLNEEWIDKHTTELMTDGTDILEMTRADCIAGSVGCTDFTEAFNNRTDSQMEHFYSGLNEYERVISDKVPDRIRDILKGYEIWEKSICTTSDIEKYNECIREIIFQIAEDYAHAWVKYLELEYDDEETRYNEEGPWNQLLLK